MNQEKRMEEIDGEDGWEMDADEEAAASGGDTLWIVTLSEGFELGLAGRLLVGEVVPRIVA